MRTIQMKITDVLKWLFWFFNAGCCKIVWRTKIIIVTSCWNGWTIKKDFYRITWKI